MKNFSLYAILFLFLTISCRKDVVSKQPISNSIIAKWTYSEYYESNGSAGSWQSVSPPNQQIEFKSDGSFAGTQSFLPDANKYEVIDSITLKFQPSASTQGYVEMSYHIDTAMRQLYLNPIPGCIEGCSNRFTR